MSLEKCKERSRKYAEAIKANEELLIEAMLEYEPYEAVKDQIARSINCLENIESEFKHFDFELNKYGAFLPLNLPLYSIVLFALIPSLYSKQVFARPPQVAAKTVEKIVSIIASYIPLDGIEISNYSRSDFLDRIEDADAVCFTGTHKNATVVRERLHRGAIFLFNGAGINPLVVLPSADIDLAVTKAIQVKAFNSGQDCAGPDAILVHSSLRQQFVDRLKEEASKIQVSSNYKDHQNIAVGPLMDPEGASRVGRFLDKFKDYIEFGGRVDYRESIVYPTILISKISEYSNYTELFSPLWFLHEFSTDEELESYFKDDKYINHCMYVSVFSRSADDIGDVGKSTMLHNQSILDVENGNSEYGGYGSMASSISFDKKTIAKPILISRDISEALRRRRSTATDAAISL